jgi:UDP-GlcNAc:undecaprenyl-phosphate/decaprenyl-phosphate GlcNAc-1-phosphate transferase
MNYSITLFWLPLLTSLAVAALLAPLVIWAYKKKGYIDDPKRANHQKVIHTYPVPRGGGIVIYGAVLAGSLLFMGVDKHTVSILFGGLILMITGIVDDIWNIHPYWRLGWGLLAASAVVGAGIGIAFITNPFGDGVLYLNQPQLVFSFFGDIKTIWILADILALIWIVWCMNMINWSKGLDGQLPGMVVIAATVIAVLSFQFTEDVTQWEVSHVGCHYCWSLFRVFTLQHVSPKNDARLWRRCFGRIFIGGIIHFIGSKAGNTYDRVGNSDD